MKVQLIVRTLVMVAITVVTFCVSSVAQIENLKIAYITNELDLSEKQAQKFWPVYKNYKSQLDQLYNKLKNEDISADEIMDVESQILNVKRKRLKELKEKDILSNDQRNKLAKAEKKFLRMLIEKYKEK